MHLCPADGAVQAAVRADPSNALSIIEEANNKECPYNWHVKRHQTQYVPIEVERKVAVKEYVDRPVSHPVPDPEVERQLQRTREELDALRATIPGLQKEQDGSLKDRLNLKAVNQKLREKIRKKDEHLTDLQTALLRNFSMAKELSDETCPEIVNIRKEQLRLCQSKTVFLQEVLRNKEEYIQEVTQALVDCCTAMLRTQKETQEVLKTEKVESVAAWEEARRLENRTRDLEQELTVVPRIKGELRESRLFIEELRRQLDDKDDVIDALEEQFRQSALDEAADLSRDEILVRMTQLRFRIGLKNAKELQSKSKILKLQGELRTEKEAVARADTTIEKQNEALGVLQANVDSLQIQLAQLRRDLLAASAPVRPIIMPAPVYDDERRLLEAPSASRAQALTEQDIVAAFGLFDSGTQGELPGWDMPLYLRVLGFNSSDQYIRKLTSDFRHNHVTLSLEEFRDVILDVQKEYQPLKMSTGNLLGQWQEASRRRIEASKRREDRKKDRAYDEDSDEDEDPINRSIAAISMRAVQMSTSDIEESFALFDHDCSGCLDQRQIGPLVHAMGLVRTKADLEALNVIIMSEFSGTLNAVEWSDVVQYCQGVQPNFVRRRVLEKKPPKQGLYPKPFPQAGRTHPMSEREIELGFKLFDVDKSGLLPGHQVPTYLECLGLVCSSLEFISLLVTQYKADLTQKVTFGYFCRMVRFVQTHLEFFNPSPRMPKVRTCGSNAQEARRAPPILAPESSRKSSFTAFGNKKSPHSRAPPSRPNTAVYSPRTRKPGQYPPWMVPSVVPQQVESIERDGSKASDLKLDTSVLPERKTESVFDPPQPADQEQEDKILPLTQDEILHTYVFYTGYFNCPQVSITRGAKALALHDVVIAIRSLGFVGVKKRFLEQIWPYERKAEVVRQMGGGVGDELILDEEEFLNLVRNIERYGTQRDPSRHRLPRQVNRHLVGGALREADLLWLFELLDYDEKTFLSARDFRTMLTLLGFSLQDEPEIQNVLVTYDTKRPSRSSREHNIFEFHDCLEVIKMLTAKPLTHRNDASSISFF